MPRDARAYLYDMERAAALISEFTAGLDFDADAADAKVRAAVERQFEIIGEALGQLAKVDPDTATPGVDDRLVWDMVVTRLDDLRLDVDRLLDSA